MTSTGTKSAILYGEPVVEGTSGTWREVATLSEAKYEQFREALWTLDSMLRRSHFAYYRGACLDFFDQVERAGERVANGSIPGSGDDSIELLSSNFIRSLVAISSLIKFEQEKTLGRITKTRGEGSNEHIQGREEYNRLYDANFGYRSLSRLRNIMQHDTMEVIRLSVRAQALPTGNIGACEVRLERSAFFESTKISSKLKQDLRDLGDDPLIIEMIAQSLIGLSGLNRFLRPLAYPNLDQLCASIREFESLFNGAAGLRYLSEGRISHNDGSFKIPRHMMASSDVLNFAHGAKAKLPRFPEFNIPPYSQPEHFK